MSKVSRQSRSHWPLRRVTLPSGISGGLWLTEMPGRSIPLDDFLSAANDVAITGLVCLVDPADIPRNSPDYAAARAETGILPEMLDFPIEDYGVPSDASAFWVFVSDLAARLQRNEHLVIHCAAGVGRTGLAAIMTLRALGLPPEQAHEAVRQAGSEPETPEQMHFATEMAHA